MKNYHLARHREAAKIYEKYYRPSLNPLRLLKSVFSLLLTGQSPAVGHYYRKK